MLLKRKKQISEGERERRIEKRVKFVCLRFCVGLTREPSHSTQTKWVLILSAVALGTGKTDNNQIFL